MSLFNEVVTLTTFYASEIIGHRSIYAKSLSGSLRCIFAQYVYLKTERATSGGAVNK